MSRICMTCRSLAIASYLIFLPCREMGGFYIDQLKRKRRKKSDEIIDHHSEHYKKKDSLLHLLAKRWTFPFLFFNFSFPIA